MSKSRTPESRTPAQKAASRENGKKSHGPTSDSGKDRSKLNSFKHGLTGAGRAFPSEVQALLDEQAARWDAAYQPRGPLEEALVFKMALAGFRLRNAAIQECAVLSRKARESIGAYDREVQDHVEQLGKLLLNDPVPRAGYPAPDRDRPEVKLWHRVEPRVLMMELTETVPGCDYLIDRWTELEFMLGNDGFWWFDSKFKAIRMLGKRPETMLDDPEVGDLFAHNFALEPESEGQWLMTCQHATWCAENRPLYHGRVDKLGERIPTDPQVARDFLYAIIDRELAALRARREELLPLWELNRSEAPLRSAFDASEEGEKRQRYETASDRSLHKSLADFLKVRKAAEEGELVVNEASPIVEEEPEAVMQIEATEEDTPALPSRVRAVQNEPDDRAAPGFEPAPEPRPTAPGWLDTGDGGGPERRFDPN